MCPEAELVLDLPKISDIKADNLPKIYFLDDLVRTDFHF